MLVMVITCIFVKILGCREVYSEGQLLLEGVSSNLCFGADKSELLGLGCGIGEENFLGRRRQGNFGSSSP